MPLPAILIVTGYEKLSAYRILPDGSPEMVENLHFKGDEQSGTRLVEFAESNRFNLAVVGQISEILERFQPDQWGLACPQDLMRKIILWLPCAQQTTLCAVRPTEVEEVDISNVCALFGATESDFKSEKDQ